MTAKEKAQQLIYTFEAFTDEENEFEFAKQCALIAVDEILEESFSIFRICGKYRDKDSIMNVEYWDEVKQEIKKL